ncbi:MAG: polyadenylate-specific 3'-exoribonuclease AS [Lawsonella sp.]|uniref:polyadenylate-specific 3'-exoribonuclease AS n=1 Tax=Lawsonella sp. TaxID=2041415 RepID=UPI002A755008|nr:polyadenylate-specific 3'-exoribonuclease AS [Lawsonella sp.]MDY2979610.1 polyadenylate-specific 3'-exoribonuclease AS [Lawsonella sp.]
MRFFYDCEFIEDGRTIDLLSLGMVTETGEELYLVSTECDTSRANPWVQRNVLPKLPNPSDSAWCDRRTMRERITAFWKHHDDGHPMELWAWVAAYDHVVLCQLWGDMAALPRGVPRFTYELKQYWMHAGQPGIPGKPVGAHNALIDARWDLERFVAIRRALEGDATLR